MFIFIFHDINTYFKEQQIQNFKKNTKCNFADQTNQNLSFLSLYKLADRVCNKRSHIQIITYHLNATYTLFSAVVKSGSVRR